MSTLPITISGRVIAGAEQARRFGYPTANLDAGPLNLEEGIYLGRASYDGAADVPSIIFYGTPHSLPEITSPRCEVHLLNRSLDLYDTVLTVRIETMVRKNKKFATDEELKKAIEDDFAIAQKHFHV